MWGSSVTSWSDVHSRLEQFAPISSKEWTKVQLAALESMFEGPPDFGFIQWVEDYVNAVEVNKDKKR